MSYRVILADPPWPYTFSNTRNDKTSDDYPRMNMDDIAQIQVPAANNCALFLWVNWPTLPGALSVMSAWGFEYTTIAWVWTKLNKNSMGMFYGMGNYTRSNSEPCLLGIRGHMPPQARDVQALIMSPIRQHSRKPDEQYTKIERLYPDGPYLEMFARRKWSERWHVFGNEVQSDVEIGVQYGDLTHAPPALQLASTDNLKPKRRSKRVIDNEA